MKRIILAAGAMIALTACGGGASSSKTVEQLCHQDVKLNGTEISRKYANECCGAMAKAATVLTPERLEGLVKLMQLKAAKESDKSKLAKAYADYMGALSAKDPRAQDAIRDVQADYNQCVLSK